MRDPHVVRLRYSLKAPESVTYKGPPAVHFSRPEFELILNDQAAVCIMASHYATVEAARAVVDPCLRAWEIKAALDLSDLGLRFVYEDAEVIDRHPPPPGSPQILTGSAAVALGSAFSGTLHVTRSRYPEPPVDFQLTPDVETLWQRYMIYQKGAEPLNAMAYFCLSLVQSSANSRTEAARQFRIDLAVLKKLGELTSERGDETTARKAPRGAAFTPMSATDREWVEAAVKALIRRVGEEAAGASLALIRMDDLPPL